MLELYIHITVGLLNVTAMATSMANAFADVNVKVSLGLFTINLLLAGWMFTLAASNIIQMIKG